MKIELVSIHIRKSPQAMPLATGMLKAMLDSKDEMNGRVESSISDFYNNEKDENIADAVVSKKPTMVGFSTYLWNREKVVNISKLIRRKIPDVILFAGGAEATANPEDLMESAPFDFVVKGEGEAVIVDVVSRLLRGEPVTGAPGVLSKECPKSSELKSFPVDDLNLLPSPYLNGTIDLEKYDGILWELSRGCPFKCAFCFESRGLETVRRFSMERIEEELKLFEKKGVSQVFVLDPTFNANRDRAKKILKMIRRIAPAIHFIFEVRTEFLDMEMAKLFSSINCSLQIGLQSSDPAVLKHVNRAFDSKKFKAKIDLLNMSGVVFGLDLIYGLPTDTLEGFKRSIDYTIKLQPNNLDVFPLSVFPGTALFEKAVSYEMNFLMEAPYRVISTPDFSEKHMAKATDLAEACSLFYNRGRAVGWLFMILETLKVSPSYFFNEFAHWMKTGNVDKNPENSELCEIQCRFTKELFQKRKKGNLYAPMADIIRYHNTLYSSMDAGCFPVKIGKIRLTENPY